MDVKPIKFLKFATNTFVPTSLLLGGVKTVNPMPPLVSTTHFSSISIALLFVSVPNKMLVMVLDNFSGDRLEWPEWFVQFIATVDESGAADSLKMDYLKILVNVKAKAAIECMG